MAHGSSQARGPIRAIAAGPSLGHSKKGSGPHQQTAPQLRATLDPGPTKPGQGLNVHPHGY